MSQTVFFTEFGTPVISQVILQHLLHSANIFKRFVFSVGEIRSLSPTVVNGAERHDTKMLLQQVMRF